MIIGVIAGVIPFLTTSYLKPLIGYDDALDVFGVHAIGGTCGALATGFLADASINSNLSPSGAGGQKMADLCDWAKGHLLYVEQLKVIVFTILLSTIGTAIIAFVLKAVMGLRPTPEQEEAGLDVSDHGEEGYIL
jgi:Amt family ammonium transporter